MNEVTPTPAPLSRHEILQRVIQSESLPTLPTVAAKLLSITSREETTVQDIANLIAHDLSLSAKVLRVVNSAFYGLSAKVGSIQQAVAILGIHAVRSLVLSFSLLNLRRDPHASFDYKRFWERSLAAAVSARLIMARLDQKAKEEVFIAGLLQNIGEMILALEFSDAYAQAQILVVQGREELLAEQQALGVDHAVIGHAIAKKWGFPLSLQLPIAYHHSPLSYLGKDEAIDRTNKVIYLSGLLANVFYSDRPEVFHRRFVGEAHKLLGLDPALTDTLAAEVHTEVNRAASYFGMELKLEHSIEEILQEANERLGQLNMTYDQMNRELLDAKMALHRLTRELQEKNRRLEDLANLDGLTGVFNHRYFQSFLQKEINRSQRHGHPLSLVMADVDNFKGFNDRFGHQAGDFILKEMCEVTATLLREYDLIARYGGEEFAFVLPETEAEAAVKVAEKIRARLAKTTFERDGQRHQVTLSLGVATMDSATGPLSPDELIARADQALLQAKKRGKNQALCYSGRGGWLGRLWPGKTDH